MIGESGLPLATLKSLREQMLQRVSKMHGDLQSRDEATSRLEARLEAWQGAALPTDRTRFKSKIVSGKRALCIVSSDEAERIIVRALSVTSVDAQFTVSPNGACYATENNGWTIEKLRVYISGLSPLVDDASYILNQMRNGAGGRMFFSRSDQFSDARDRRAFLIVVPGDAPPIIR